MDSQLKVVVRLAGRSTHPVHDSPVTALQHEELNFHEGSFAAVPSL
jgi:hypothetical protein